LFVHRAAQATSESGKNASGHEAFGNKAWEAPVEQSPVVSTADVTSLAVGAGATAVSAAEKVETNPVHWRRAGRSLHGQSTTDAIPADG
jgi:hypothetical protein